MMRRVTQLAAAVGATILAMAFAPDAAWAERRVALVVGNAKYQTVPQLPNPVRDALSVAAMFKEAGFDVIETQFDVGNIEFKRSIRRFETTADQADIAVVYYAGHGLEVNGINYLVPTDARLASDRDAEDEAIPLERLVSSADGARRLRLIILDACRDNPFVTTMRRERKTATRAASSGLGRVEPTSTDTLIAYAAKAGSTAEDGLGAHSPFTTSLLKNLTVPGLDVRLAFGRVRDEVMKMTGNKQEPFVYGSLGGGNISLVPAPAAAQEATTADVKADYELVKQIGSKRAWEVFLGTHPKGFYSDLARAQIEELNKQQATVQLAALPQQPPQPPSATPTREQIEWDKLKDSTDIAALRSFIKRFPDAPLAITAQQRVDLLTRAAQEREEKARAEREAARKAAEEAQRLADLRKAELAAQKKREDDERRAREAEAAERAKAVAAEAAAAKKREEDERRAKALEAEQKAKAAEAERKAAEAKAKAEQAERDRLAAEAAAQKAAADKAAKAAEAEQRAKAAEAERKAAEERRKAEAEAAAARVAAEKAEASRRATEAAAAREATCKSEQARLEAITTKGSEGSGLEDLKAFAKGMTCDRLGGVVVATLDRFKTEAAKRAAAMPNSPELIAAAQGELIRVGCLVGKPDGTLNPSTSAALVRYMKIGGQPTDNVSVTQTLVAELTRHATRVCPIECKAGETLKGETCVAEEKKAPAVAAKPKSDEDDAASRKKQQAARPAPEKAKPAPEPQRARQQAVARPSIVSGGGGGGGRATTMIGVGF